MTMIKRNLLIFLFLFCCPISLFSMENEVVIGILRDGNAKRFAFEKEIFKDKIIKVAGQRKKIVFPDKFDFNGGFDPHEIEKKGNYLLNDKRVDIIIAVGPVGSHILSKKEVLNKPVIASVIVDSYLQKLPANGNSSGKKNLNYIQSFHGIFEGVELFKKLTDFKKLGIISDKAVIDVFEIEKSVEELKDFDIEIKILKAPDDQKKLSLAEYKEIDAVMITPLPQYSWENFKDLIKVLDKRGIPSFSIWGESEVEMGATSGMSGKSRAETLSKRVALQIEKILSGEKPENLKTDYRQDSQMLINISSAEKLGISPDWQTILNSGLIEKKRETLKKYGLKELLLSALSNNPEFGAVKKETKKSLFDEKIASGYLLPQAGVIAEGIKRDVNTSGSGMGQYPENETNLKFYLRQSVFDDEVFSKKFMAKKGYEAAENYEESKKLITAAKVSDAFFSYLTAENIKDIKRNDLELSKVNLSRAKVKEEVGASGPADKYRWQSRVADAKKDLFYAKKSEKQALSHLERVVGEKIAENKDLLVPNTDSDFFWISENDFKGLLNNSAKLDRAKTILGKFAIENSPEMKSYEKLIEAQKRDLTYLKRKHFIPKVYLKGEYLKRVSRFGEGSGDTVLSKSPPLIFEEPKDYAWQVGLEVKLPLFTGFIDSRTKDKSSTELKRLEILKMDLEDKIKENIKFLLDEAVSSNMNIYLSKESSLAAKKNLKLVSDAYLFGLADSVDLIDAQHLAKVSKEVSVTSLYEFMNNMFSIQIRLGFIDFEKHGDTKKRIKELLGGK